MAALDSAHGDHMAAAISARRPDRQFMANQFYEYSSEDCHPFSDVPQQVYDNGYLDPLLAYFLYNSDPFPLYSKNLSGTGPGNLRFPCQPFLCADPSSTWADNIDTYSLKSKPDIRENVPEALTLANNDRGPGVLYRPAPLIPDDIHSSKLGTATNDSSNEYLNPSWTTANASECWSSSTNNTISMEDTPQTGFMPEFVPCDDLGLTWPLTSENLESNLLCRNDLADLSLHQHPADRSGTDIQRQTVQYFDDVPNVHQSFQPSHTYPSYDIASRQSSEAQASRSSQGRTVGLVDVLDNYAATNDKDTISDLPMIAFDDASQNHMYLDQGNVLLRTTVVKSRSSKKSGVTKAQRGGRHQPLTRQQRITASDMRKTGACWCCAIQRDKCDHNEPCERCRQKWLRTSSSPLTILRCDRRPLVQLLDLVIPPSLCKSTTRSEALNFVSVRIRCWLSVSLVVPLSFGYGPLIDWVVMREFKLHAEYDNFGYELFYDTSETAVTLQMARKKSPCLALTQINEEDHAKFNKFIDDIIEQCPDRFIQECFEHEHHFQTDVLRLLCDLYQQLHNNPETDKRLHKALHNVLRMLVVTNLIYNPLKIPAASMPSVISQLETDNRLDDYAPQGPSRIASFQIKYYLIHIRSETYAAILKTLHSIYRTGEQKEKTWLVALCCTLGLSMVLEECQHLLHIQWDSRIVKEGVDPVIAKQNTLADCGLIDEQFAFLVQLFNVKYSRKNVRYPRYGDYLPSCTAGGPEEMFIIGLRRLMDENVDCLRSRVNLDLSLENERQWTSRLLARFLDHFMELDLGSQI